MSSRQKNSGSGGGRGRFRKSKGGQASGRDDLGKREGSSEIVDESSPVIKAFRIFQQELDNRNDRHERIMKLSRDITIESKRLIFLLQRVAGSEEKESIMTEAASKMKELHTSKFLPLAKELNGQDPFQFSRAYTAGLQEYIEAVTFYHYLANRELVGVDKIQSELTFTTDNLATDQVSDFSRTENFNKISKCDTDLVPLVSSKIETESSDSAENGVSSTSDETRDFSSSSIPSDKPTWKVSVPIPPSDYILGVADFTGELMRLAINSVGAGDIEGPNVVAEMMRVIHNAFTTFANTPRELRNKIRVLRQSLQKVENACYALKVRGSEIPKHMLADVFTTSASAPGGSFSGGLEEPDELYD